MSYLRFIFLFCFVVFGSKVFGQVQTLTNSSPKTIGSQYGFMVGVSAFSNLYQKDSALHSSGMEFDFVPSYYGFENLTLSVRTSVGKDLQGERKARVRNTQLVANYHLYEFDGDMHLYLRGTVILPTDSEENKITSLRGGINIAPNLVFAKAFDVTGLNISYTPSITRNFHEFQTSTRGDSNTQYSFSNRLNVYYSFLEKFSFNTYFQNTNRWNYLGNRRSDVFAMGETFTYQAMKQLYIYVGHEIQNSTFSGVNNTNLNIELFNQSASTIYTGLNYYF